MVGSLLPSAERGGRGPRGGSVDEGGECGGYVYGSEGAEPQCPAVVELLPEAVGDLLAR